MMKCGPCNQKIYRAERKYMIRDEKKNTMYHVQCAHVVALGVCFEKLVADMERYTKGNNEALEKVVEHLKNFQLEIYKSQSEMESLKEEITKSQW